MVVGILDRRTGTRDLSRLPALGREWRWIERHGARCRRHDGRRPAHRRVHREGSRLRVVRRCRFGGHWSLLAAAVRFGADGRVLRAVLLAAFVAPRRRAAMIRSRGGPPTDRGAVVEIGAPAALLASDASCSGCCRRGRTGSASASARRCTAGRRSVHLAIWHGGNLEFTLSVPRARKRRLVFALYNRWRPTPGPGCSFPSASAHTRDAARGAQGVAPGDGRGATRIAPGVRRVILTTAMGLPAWVLVSRWDWSGLAGRDRSVGTCRSSASSWSRHWARTSCGADSPPPCSSAPRDTRWPRSSWPTARPTWRSRRSRSRRCRPSCSSSCSDGCRDSSNDSRVAAGASSPR